MAATIFTDDSGDQWMGMTDYARQLNIKLSDVRWRVDTGRMASLHHGGKTYVIWKRAGNEVVRRWAVASDR